MIEMIDNPDYLNWHIRLRRVLVEYFDEDELETLCFDLRVDFEDLEGENKTQRTVSLILYLARANRIDELIELCSELRPNVPWSELRTAAKLHPLIAEERLDQVVNRRPSQKSGHHKGQMTAVKSDVIHFPPYVAIALTAVVVIGMVLALFVVIQAFTSEKALPATPIPTHAGNQVSWPPTPVQGVFSVSAETETTAVMAAPPTRVLLSANFEAGQSRAWLSASSQPNPHIVTLPNGNRALQIRNGVEALYTPSWDWNISDYRLEADVMVADLRSGTSIGWNARLLNDDPVGYCLGYRAEIGPDWAALHRVTTPGENCDSDWVMNALNYGEFAFRAGEWRHLRLDVIGNQLRFYVDGRLALTGTDPDNRYPTGGIGLIVFESDEAYIDNVVVTDLTAAP